MTKSAHYQIGVISKAVFRDLQVVWRGPFAGSSRQIIMAAVARAEPTSPVTSIGQGNATQVGAHTHHYQPLQHQWHMCESHSSKCNLAPTRQRAMLLVGPVSSNHCCKAYRLGVKTTTNISVVVKAISNFHHW